MKRVTTMVATLLALSLWAGSSNHASNEKVRDSRSATASRDSAVVEKANQNREHDDNRNGRGNGKGAHHDSEACGDDRHDHGNPKPPKPPKDPAGVPLVPSGLVAEAVSLFQVNLTWADNSTNELGFKIDRSLDGTNFTQIAQVLPNTTVYRDLNRFPDTKYFYRARTFNAKGNSAYSAVARTQTPAPDCELSLSIQSPTYYGSSLKLTGAVAIAPGAYHNLILKRDGTVSLSEFGMVTNIANLSDIVALAAGAEHSMALKSDGTVVAWGQNLNSQTNVPTNLSGVVAIAAGGAHSLGLKNDGTVVAWGDDEWWQARPPTNLIGVVAIAAGDRHSLALRSDGTVVGWGFNDQHAAQPPPNLHDVIAIAAGHSHSLALKSDGTVVSWGITEEGLFPPDLTNVIAIVAGQAQSFALKRDGTFAYWGSGQYTQLIPQLDLGGVVALASSYANHMFITTLPAAPAFLGGQLLASNRVALTWQDFSDGTATFEIKRGTVFAPDSFPGFPGSSPTNWNSLGRVAAGITQFSDLTIVAGESYWYQVSAQNNCGISTGDGVAAVTISPPVNPPRIFATAIQANDVTLSWVGENVGVTRSLLERAPDANGQPAGWSEIAIINPSPGFSSYYTDVGLLPNSTNWYRVRVENGLGVSPYSEPVQIVIVPPSAPRFLYTLIGDTNQVILGWTPDPPNDQEGLKVERSEDASGQPGVWSEIAGNVPLPDFNTTYTDTNALAGHTYWYRVRSFNRAGISDYSQPTSVALVPPTILSLYAKSTSNAVVLVVWPYRASESVHPRFERAEDTANQQGEWHAIAPEPIGNTIAYLDRGLKNDVGYRYRAKAINWLGESPYSEPVGVSLALPAPPPYISAVVGRTNRITVQWSPTYNSDHTGFKIERRVETGSGAGPWTSLASVGLTNSAYYIYEDTVVPDEIGRTFRYRVRAFNIVGISEPSESQPVALKPPAITAMSATSYQNQATLYWSANYYGFMGFNLQRAPDRGGAPGPWTEITAIGTKETAGGYYLDALPPIAGNYWYRVRAFSWVGTSEFSEPVSVQIQPPATPSLLSAKLGSTNQVALFWDYVGSDVDELQIERAQYTAGGLGAWQQVARLTVFVNGFLGIGQTYTDSNAVAHAEYAYRIRTANAIGPANYSEPLRVNITPPPPLTTIQATVYGGRVSLSYSRGAGYYDYGEISGFEVERTVELNGTPGGWTQIAAPYDYSYIDTSPPPNSTCRYRVRVVNWVGGSDYFESASVTIIPPEPPRQLAAKVGGTNQVELSWLAPPANDQDGFLLELADDVAGQPAAWQPLATIGATNLWGGNFTQTNAVAFATNWYRVRAFNPAGVSAYTEPLQFIVSPPPAPVQFAPSQFLDRVNLAWNVYTFGEVGGFKVERALDLGGNPGTWTEITLVPATNSFSGWWYAAYADAGRTVGSTCWYRVRAYNWVGDGDYSATTLLTVKGPQTPGNLFAGIGSTNQIAIWWFPGGPDIDGYYLERAADAGGGPTGWSQIATIPQGHDYPRFTDTNLTSQTTNWYRVRSFNVLGVSPASPAVRVRIEPPPAPVVIYTSTFANRTHLDWYFNSANYGMVAGYKIERAPDVLGVPGVWAEITDVAREPYYSDYQGLDDPNLPAPASYWYRLRSYNWLGVGPYSAGTRITLTPPKAPVNLYNFGASPTAVELYWRAAEPEDQDGFKLERRTDTQGTWTEIAMISATNSLYVEYADSNPVANVTNYYRVRAFNVVGDSLYSSTAAALIQLPPSPALIGLPPQILSLTLTNQDVLLTWQALGGTTNIVEASSGSTAGFVPLSANWRIEGDGLVTTNFLDFGARTNSPARFYRIRSLP